MTMHNIHGRLKNRQKIKKINILKIPKKLKKSLIKSAFNSMVEFQIPNLTMWVQFLQGVIKNI